MIKTAVAAFTAVIWASIACAQEPTLVRLPKSATTPILGFKKGSLRETGKEMNLGGWLVLNGARFRNAEFPALANILTENYARQGRVSERSEFTRLSTAICGGLPAPRGPGASSRHGEQVTRLSAHRSGRRQSGRRKHARTPIGSPSRRETNACSAYGPSARAD
jgi:hypothetical protein